MKKTITILAILFATLQTQAQSNIKLGASVNYHLPMCKQKESTSPFLFLNAAQSAGLELSFAPNANSSTRIKLAVDYITGTNDKNAVATYAKEKNIVYSGYEFTKAKSSGFSVMASPQFMLYKKGRKKAPLVWLDLKAGLVYSNQQSVQFFSPQTTAYKEIKPSPWNIAYSPSLVVNVVKTNKIFINAKVGYSNYGGIGV